MDKEIYKPGTKVYLGPDVYYEAMSGDELDRSKSRSCTVVSDRVRQRYVRFPGELPTTCCDCIITAADMKLYYVYLQDNVDLRLTPEQRSGDCYPGLKVKLTSDAVRWKSKLKHLEGEELLVGSYVYYDEETREACVNLTWRCGGLIKLGIGTVGPWDYLKKIRED